MIDLETCLARELERERERHDIVLMDGIFVLEVAITNSHVHTKAHDVGPPYIPLTLSKIPMSFPHLFNTPLSSPLLLIKALFIPPPIFVPMNVILGVIHTPPN